MAKRIPHPELLPSQAGSSAELADAQFQVPDLKNKADLKHGSFAIGAVLGGVSVGFGAWVALSRFAATLPHVFYFFGFVQLLYTLPCALALGWSGQRRTAAGVATVSLFTALIWPVTVAMTAIGATLIPGSGT